MWHAVQRLFACTEKKVFLLSLSINWEDLFETYDTNRDGYIDNVELGKQLNDMDLDISNQDLNDMINLFDSDGDKKLNAIEYKKLYKLKDMLIT